MSTLKTKCQGTTAKNRWDSAGANRFIDEKCFTRADLVNFCNYILSKNKKTVSYSDIIDWYISKNSVQNENKGLTEQDI